VSPLAERGRRLSRREQVGIALVGALGLALWAYQILYRPQLAKLRKGRSEWSAARGQVSAMRAALPNLEQERRELQQQAKDVDRLRQEVAGAERQLISAGDLGHLLGALAKQGEGLQVAFESIKQHEEKTAESPQAALDVAFTSPYEDLVTYLRRVERISPFLRVAWLDVTEPKGGPKAFGAARITLAIPLRASADEGGPSLDVGTQPVERISLPRSPFTSRQRPREETERRKLKVTGITWRGEASTAIVNDAVVRVGDKVDDFTVTRILQDKVILSDGAESYTVPLEK